MLWESLSISVFKLLLAVPAWTVKEYFAHYYVLLYRFSMQEVYFALDGWSCIISLMWAKTY